MLGISLLQYIRKRAESAWPGLTIEQPLEQLQQIQQYNLLYPPQGDKGPNRVATVLSKQTLAQLPHFRAAENYFGRVCGHSDNTGGESALCFQRAIFRPSLSWIEKPV
jgi:hypothetical protein